MARPTDDTWVVKLDEHHPHPGVAAKYADQESRLFTRRVLSERIKALLGRTAVLTYEETVELKSARSELNRTNEAIAEFDNEKED